MNSPLRINNETARKLFLQRHCLSENPSRKCCPITIAGLIKELGFVQVDSIRTVERAHHMILHARNHNYRTHHLSTALEKHRSLFENWTHDASIIPVEFYAHWKHRFKKQRESLPDKWKKWGREGFMETLEEVITHLDQNGPTLARELKKTAPRPKGESGWWDWHPHKSALEYLWRSGEIAICHRRGFQKAYDLSSRVIGDENINAQVSESEFINWACRSALERLGFATHGEIAAFWGLISPAQAKQWVEDQSELIELRVEGFTKKQGDRALWAFSDVKECIEHLPQPPKKIRVLSPFDPLLRDRKRALFLYGFDYRIEIFVPEAKRKFGYYVFPLLRGSKLIGRIDMKNEAESGSLRVAHLWIEPASRWSDAAMHALERELQRLAKFAGMQKVEFATDFKVSNC